MARGVFSSVSKTKKKILAAYDCQYCGSDENLCIDHILPPSRGGNSEIENLTKSCISCNSMKTSMTVEEWEMKLTSKINDKQRELDRFVRILTALKNKTYKIDFNG